MIKGGCDFVACLYLFTQLLYVKHIKSFYIQNDILHLLQRWQSGQTCRKNYTLTTMLYHYATSPY